MVDLVVEVPVERSPQGRWIDRIDSRLLNGLTAVALALPVFAYFWLIHRYSVNVIFGDQWSDVTVIAHPSWSNLWAQHNENRIFFPNLIVLALTHTTHLNTQVENYLGAVMLTESVGLLVWAHIRRSETPRLYYVPFVVLAFSWAQVSNALWGFQMAWWLVMLSLAVAVVLIDRPTLTWLFLCGAILAGVVGSFSSLQGLLIWPAGLVLLSKRRRSRKYILNWVIAGVLTTVGYFVHFSNAKEAYRYALDHPLNSLKFFVFAIGDVAGFPYRGNATLGLLLGVVILCLAAYVLVFYGGSQGAAPIGIALICVGLLFALLITEGRSYFGYYEAASGRYATFDLLVPLGIFLALLEKPERRLSLQLVRVLTAAVFVLLIVAGYYYGLQGARRGHTNDLIAAHVLRNIDTEPNPTVSAALYPTPVPYVRHQAQIAEARHLSLFYDP